MTLQTTKNGGVVKKLIPFERETGNYFECVESAEPVLGYKKIDGKVYFDPEGNSILSVYPFFLLLFFLFQIKHLKDKKKLYFLLVSALVLVFEFVLILLYFATGWVQFGSRYIADIVPLALLMSAFAVESISSLFLLLILIYGIIINLFGTLFFYQKFPI